MRRYRKYIIPFFALCVVLLISEKNDYLRYKLLVSEFNFKDTSALYHYGDLYRQCLIEDFKENFYWPNRTRQFNPDSAGIFLIGDSYFERPIAGNYIASELEKETGCSVFDITAVNSGSADDPISALDNISFNKNKKRILVLETTERFSAARSLEQYIPGTIRAGFPNLTGLENDEIKNWIYKVFLNRQFYIEHNYLSYPVLSFKNTIDFKVFRQVDINIGAFSLSPPMLFYSQDVEFAMRVKTSETLDSMVDKIAELKEIISRKFNLTMIYIIIPDKFSVYNDYVNGEYKYSGFIPGLAKKLSGKDICTIDLYTAFMDFRKKYPDKLLYNKSDSHFNDFGKSIFIEMTGAELKKILNDF